MSNIEINHISKAYGGKKVLSDMNMCFEEGCSTCIMGPSGCGKTTLLRIISGLEKPDEGEITGKVDKVSFVFQEDRLSENYSVISNIRFIVGKKMPTKTIMKMLQEMGLGDCVHKPVKELSGGMKRRVTIARALCASYDLLIMDEPLKGLDEKLKENIMNVIKNNTKGKTVIIVTHDRGEADYFGGKIIEM